MRKKCFLIYTLFLLNTKYAVEKFVFNDENPVEWVNYRFRLL